MNELLDKRTNRKKNVKGEREERERERREREREREREAEREKVGVANNLYTHIGSKEEYLARRAWIKR